MKRTCLFLFVLACIAATAFSQSAPFTYQGRFNQNGTPVSGVAEMQFTLWSAESGGTQLAATSPATQSVNVSNGLFTATIDFTPVPFTGADRWLQIEARTTLGAFTLLTPRQKITSAPYALRAANFSGAVADSQLSPNVARLNANQAFTGAVSLNNPLNTFTGNGGGLSNVTVNSLVRTTTNSSVVAWGFNGNGETDVPAGLNDIVGVAVGGFDGFAWRSDGTAVSWGGAEADVPPGLSGVIAITAGYVHGLALKSNGQVVAWGDNRSGQTNVPSGLNNVIAVSAGGFHNLAVKSDGTVVAWGQNDGGQTNVPAGLNNVVAVAGGYYHNLALKNDGTVVVWGFHPNAPAGLSNVVAVAAGGSHSLALKNDGTVIGWGENLQGQAAVPPGLNNVVAIAAGYQHSLALRNDGMVVAWGNNDQGQATPPLNLNNVIAIAPGSSASHAVAIRKQAHSPVAWLEADNRFGGHIQVDGSSTFNGNMRMNGMIVGKVGIGTPYPEQLLHLVVQPGTGEGMRIDSAIPGYSPAIYLNHAGNLNFSIASYGEPDSFESSSFVIRDDLQSADRLTIDEMGIISGNGAGLTSLNAANVSSGTLADARLSTNVARLNADQTFVGRNTFASSLVGSSAGGFALPQLRAEQTNPGDFARLRLGVLGAPQWDIAVSPGATPDLRFWNGSADKMILSYDGNLSFGTQTRQMLNLWGTQYGIGVQAYTTYFRAANDNNDPKNGFIWYRGGVHNDNYVANGGAGGGTEMMHLVPAGLYVNGALVVTSDRNAKENFKPVDARAVLDKVTAMPLSEWNYKQDAATRHIGPMAQDFHAAFGVGPDDKHIATVDADGVALAAIQGLNQKLEEQRAELQARNLELASMRRELAELKRLVSGLTRQ